MSKASLAHPQAREPDLSPHHYRITVTSTATPTYAELCEAYGWASEFWDKRKYFWDKSKYTLKLHESLRELTPPTGEVTAFLKKFDGFTTPEKAIEWGKIHGYRLAFPWEREVFSKANPDLQRKFWIVDLGSFVVHDDDRYVPLLLELINRRGLGIDWFGGGFGAGRRCLFVRE